MSADCRRADAGKARVLRRNETDLAGERAGRLSGDTAAITAVEYGIVAAFLCLSLLGIFTRFGTVITALFSTATSGI